MQTEKPSLLVYLGKISKETKSPGGKGAPELSNPIFGYVL